MNALYSSQMLTELFTYQYVNVGSGFFKQFNRLRVVDLSCNVHGRQACDR